MPATDDDLALTIRELSNGCEHSGVRTAAVLFLDKNEQTLSAKAALGDWSPERVIHRDAGPVWKAIESKKTAAFCKPAETFDAMTVGPAVQKDEIQGRGGRGDYQMFRHAI
jgi:hypothetical protein